VGLFLRPRRPLLRLAAGATQATRASPASPPPPALAAGPPPGSIAELERLSRLHASGALTDEEFAAAKARALGI
jgi:hypothetical protein